MQSKFGNSSIPMREVIKISILKGFDQKNFFLWGVVHSTSWKYST